MYTVSRALVGRKSLTLLNNPIRWLIFVDIKDDFVDVKMQVRIFNNERTTNQKKSYDITLPIHETTFHNCIQTFEQ